ncbi:uncharacterized protein BJ212DRAFT_1298259 [Suillus subaureus]|uniref:Uncharacterized protein n=1 Tax=Suillus subaureus TaxID=48587 RepID=A0A9P7EFA3_9AGAM|nr:uncharacterized protein BJ212DRAFT_1298259 [Suillus subaureus]KAG1819867.1 hypothetical protein BJ212DRAFT_1298259 [Suillus subaureus]
MNRELSLTKIFITLFTQNHSWETARKGASWPLVLLYGRLTLDDRLNRTQRIPQSSKKAFNGTNIIVDYVWKASLGVRVFNIDAAITNNHCVTNSMNYMRKLTQTRACCMNDEMSDPWTEDFGGRMKGVIYQGEKWQVDHVFVWKISQPSTLTLELNTGLIVQVSPNALRLHA